MSSTTRRTSAVRRQSQRRQQRVAQGLQGETGHFTDSDDEGSESSGTSVGPALVVVASPTIDETEGDEEFDTPSRGKEARAEDGMELFHMAMSGMALESTPEEDTNSISRKNSTNDLSAGSFRGRSSEAGLAETEPDLRQHAKTGAHLLRQLHGGHLDEGDKNASDNFAGSEKAAAQGGRPPRPPQRAKAKPGVNKPKRLPTELPTDCWFALELFDAEEYSATGGASGLFLDVKSSAKRKGTPLIVWPPGGGNDEAAVSADNGTGGIPDNQLWRYDAASGCLFSRIGHDNPKQPPLVADVAEGKDEPGGKLITWTETKEAPNQKFAVASIETIEPWTPMLPSMSGEPALSVPDLEITTGRRVTPLGDPDMPPEIAALLAGTILPPSSGKRRSRMASGRASGGGSVVQESIQSYDVLQGHNGGLVVTLCLPLLEFQGEPLAVGVLQGVAAVVSRRASTTIARRASAGPINAGGQVVTLDAAKAKCGPGSGGCIAKWRVIPAGSEGVIASEAESTNRRPPPPGFEMPMRRGS